MRSFVYSISNLFTFRLFYLGIIPFGDRDHVRKYIAGQIFGSIKKALSFLRLFVVVAHRFNAPFVKWQNSIDLFESASETSSGV